MIIWLASYPRSGNTLFRILLARHFGLTTWSLYGDGDPRSDSNPLAPVLGFDQRGPLGEEALAAMAAASDTFVVKTHDLPPAGRDWPAICIVRDGRSALASYWHYRNRPGDTAPAFEEVVAGAVQFGSWSAHAAAWLDAPLSRRLVLRFEDLVRPSAATLAEVGRFIGRAPARAEPPDFAALHALEPEHFRVGDDARNIAELEACCPALFNALHGGVQARLGYPPAAVLGDPAVALGREIGALLAWLHGRIAGLRQELAAAQGAVTVLRRDVAAAQGAVTVLRQEVAAARSVERDLRDALDAARREVAGMRRSPFWRAREAAVGLLRATGLRRRG